MFQIRGLGLFASGALIGGLTEGIRAAGDGRDFWNGGKWKTVNKYSLPDGDLPKAKQPQKEVGCTQTVLESNAEAQGRPITIENKNEGVDYAILAREHGFETNTVMPGTSNSEHTVGAQLILGNPAAITYNEHTVGLNSIEVQQVPRLFGSGVKTRRLIQVMDPLYGEFRRMPISQFRNGVIRVHVPLK